MHYFLRIIKYIKPYAPFAILNILSNIISVAFSLVSLTMVIPFLGILFGTQEKVYNPQPISFKADAIKDNFYAIISSTIDQKGEVEAFIYMCASFNYLFFQKCISLFRIIFSYSYS